ncbi:hypothetical protein NLU13_8467 [Sarocladium strictum]|uniref:Vacuolar protein sorting-associated protein 51 homolog n=1 Tax=Sarocladium strictum TaxID=5046 RepID=A0AA39L563_SARSR|nr:hypothetical protein NLU13_8467 [Sarocladium strictum]
MSTIASPREPSNSLRRLPSGTPTSSARPSLEAVRSTVTSPVQSHPPSIATGPAKRSNRKALREYYNLRAPRIEVPDSEVPASEIDEPGFDADAYVAKVVKESSLEELLRLYAKVLGEVRALDAEKKALVYDNYSKLITATETISKMRANMDPLNPMASTLDPAIAHIYSQASSIRDNLRQSVPAPDSKEGQRRAAELRRRRTKELATEVLGMPEKMRALVKEGKVEEARKQWEMPRRLLERWRERGVGGEDVGRCIEEGDGVLNAEAGSSASSSTRVSKDGR